MGLNEIMMVNAVRVNEIMMVHEITIGMVSIEIIVLSWAVHPEVCNNVQTMWCIFRSNSHWLMHTPSTAFRHGKMS